MNAMTDDRATTAVERGGAPAVGVLSDLAGAMALRDPDRRRLVEALREEPDSASGLARRLGDSRQRLNYHLRTLEAGGVVELQEERRKGNCVERVMRVAAGRFVLDPSAVEGLPDDPAEAGDRFSATYLVALAARAIRELADLRTRAGRRRQRLGTVSLDGRIELPSPAAMQAFLDDLTDAVGEVVARHHVPGEGSRPFRIMAGAWPAPPGPGTGTEGAGGDHARDGTAHHTTGEDA